MHKYRTTPDAVRLQLEGALALSELESTGIRVDADYIDRTIADATATIHRHEQAVRDDPDFKFWRRRYADKATVSSPEQLAGVVFGDLGHPAVKGRTAKGKRDKADENAFAHVSIPLVQNYFAAAKARKGRDYILGIKREMVRRDDGLYYVHPHNHLNTVASFRASSSSPNIRNQPNRNPFQADMVRKAYVPRPGHQFIEIDQAQVEVRVPAVKGYTNDPVLREYVCDPTKDMHGDIAQVLFKLTREQVKGCKIARHVAKNQVVFPLFYGSYYVQCAMDVWESVDLLKITLSDGTTLRDHLTAVGLVERGLCDPDLQPKPGTFEAHVKAIEEDFWSTRFRKYAQWKRDWFAAYERDGGFMMLTGFAVNVPLERKQVCNYPIQGSAYHLMLWALPRINRWLRKNKMRTRAVAEIYDCVLLDAHPSERDDVIHAVSRIMTEGPPSVWDWLDIPLVAEAECCPIDASWFDKASLREADGAYVPADAAKWAKNYGPWERQVVA